MVTAGGWPEALRERLCRVKGLLVDLEGTVRFGGVPVPGAADALNQLRETGYALRFTTNIDSMRGEEICRGLTEIGAQAEPGEIFTPVAALHRFVEQNPGRRWFLLLSGAVEDEFAELERTAGTPDFVVVGDFRDAFTYARLNEAYRHLMKGAAFLALQSQPFFMGPDGHYLDTGAVVHMLEWASGARATILGKPSAEYYLLALQEMGLRPEEALAVGDDVGTDIKGAAAAGCASILVRTGKFHPDTLAAAAAQPDLVLDSLAAVPEVLAQCRM